MTKMRNAKYTIGQVVKHRLFSFRGVVFDVDPEFNNTEEWWQAIPAETRPRKDQPFYHLFAENAETEYVAYVSEQNLLPDTSGHAGAASAGGRSVRARRQRRLPAAPQPVELTLHPVTGIKRRGRSRAFSQFALRMRLLLGRGAQPEPQPRAARPSSFLRASSAFFCSSSCSLRC